MCRSPLPDAKVEIFLSQYSLGAKMAWERKSAIETQKLSLKRSNTGCHCQITSNLKYTIKYRLLTVWLWHSVIFMLNQTFPQYHFQIRFLHMYSEQKKNWALLHKWEGVQFYFRTLYLHSIYKVRRWISDRNWNKNKQAYNM